MENDALTGEQAELLSLCNRLIMADLLAAVEEWLKDEHIEIWN